MQRSLRHILLTAAVGLFLMSCDSQGTNDEIPPAIPPTEAFSLQTDLFQTGNGKTDAVANFTAAAARVWPVSVILTANLVVPVAVTAAALQDEPSLDGGAWVWSTSTQVDGKPVQFTLTGRPVRGEVEWSMHVTAAEPVLGATLDDFELYTAQTAYDGLSGSWQLYYLIGGTSRNVLNADYLITSADVKEITYAIPASAEHIGGDSVRYGTDGSGRDFMWQQVAAGFHHDIAWDAATHAGSITATNFNGGERGCWDESLQDVACAQ